MLRSKKKLLFIALIGIPFWIASPLGIHHSAAQETFIPQVPWGDFGTDRWGSDIVVWNDSGVDCDYSFDLTQGARVPTFPLPNLDGAQQTNPYMFSVGPNARKRIKIRTPGTGNGVGAAVIDSLLAQCGRPNVTIRYEITDPAGTVGELVNYPAPDHIRIGDCVRFGFTHNEFEQLAIAIFARNSLSSVNFRIRVLDPNGVQMGPSHSEPFGGGHDAFLLTERMDIPNFFEDGTMEGCLDGPSNLNIKFPDEAAILALNVKQLGRVQTEILFPEIFRETCTEGPFTKCLNRGRFKVETNWREAASSGQALVFPTSDDGAKFYLGLSNNQMLVQLLDKCSTGFNSFWVFAAAQTNVEYDLTVTDTATGESRVYENPLGQPAEAITDTSAFATCP